MLAKLTAKNQLTLPKRALEAVGAPTHFEVAVEDGRLVLTPSRPGAAEAARAKLELLGIGPEDVEKSVAWARRR